jgi:nicotinic acid phosphoribosyltransferase
MGGNLLQNYNRDTHQFAIKCCAAKNSNGEWYDVYKDPKTMSSKSSKRGRFSLVNKNGTLTTIPYDENLGENDLLQTVFENGELVYAQTFEEIRDIAKNATPVVG